MYVPVDGHKSELQIISECAQTFCKEVFCMFQDVFIMRDLYSHLAIPRSSVQFYLGYNETMNQS